MGILKWFMRAVGWLGDVQAIMAIVPAGVLAVITAVSAHLAQEGLHWTLFTATGVFVFVTFAALLLRENRRSNRLEHKLNVNAVAFQQLVTPDGVTLFRPSFALENIANFEVFFEVIEADYSFGAVRGALDKTAPLRGLIPPHQPAGLLISACQGDPPLLPTGRLRVKVKYGREKDQYTHILDTTLECFPQNSIPVGQGGVIEMTRLIHGLEYYRA